MVISLETAILLFSTYLIFGIKPGPYMMAFISLSASGHLRGLIFFWLGTAMAMVAMYSAVLLSLDYFSQYMASLSVPLLMMKLIAAVIFINLGVSGFRKLGLSDAKKAGKAKAKEISLADAVENWGSGFLLTASNPYHIIYVFSVIPALLNTISFSGMDIIFINTVSVLADLTIITGFCLPIIIMSHKINDDILVRIKQIANVVMITIGLYILYSIFDQWDLIQTGILNQNLFKREGV